MIYMLIHDDYYHVIGLINNPRVNVDSCLFTCWCLESKVGQMQFIYTFPTFQYPPHPDTHLNHLHHQYILMMMTILVPDSWSSEHEKLIIKSFKSQVTFSNSKLLIQINVDSVS